MSQYGRSCLFMLLECGSNSVEDATASQLVLLVFILGREGNALPEFVFKIILVGLCVTQAQVQQK